MLLLLLGLQLSCGPVLGNAGDGCLDRLGPGDACLVTDFSGRTIYERNKDHPFIPASTLKILTALVALHHFGDGHRFRTAFYLDADRNLTVKGYGDPLLVSEVLSDMADRLRKELGAINDLVVDDGYFAPGIRIPGRSRSANPYDAPVSAVSVNFNTICFRHDAGGRIVSAEPQTPMIPFARKKAAALDAGEGRYTFTHKEREAALYAGHLLLHFLKERGIAHKGGVRRGRVQPDDLLLATYPSPWTLEQVVKRMLAFSNNFMANQMLIALGAHLHGPPGTLKKGVKVVTAYAARELKRPRIRVVEGSGLSRQNRLSAADMVAVLEKFAPYRHLLQRMDRIRYKTGSLRGIRTRAGYAEAGPEGPACFVIFKNRSEPEMDSLMTCVGRLAASAADR